MIIRASNRTPVSLPSDRGAVMRRDAAKEKALSRYTPMTCGHYASREIDELYGTWKPRRGYHYCEACCKWFPVAKKTKPRYPDIPLF